MIGLLYALVPLNLEEERAKFFANPGYNPQFQYSRQFSDLELNKYGLPKLSFFNHAKKMLDRFGLPASKPSTPMNLAVAANEVFRLIDQLDLPKLSVHFEAGINSQVLIDFSTLKFRTPLNFSLESLRNKLNHEIQTHYLRRYNQKLQSWDFDSEAKLPKEFRITEEGLANLHSYIERTDAIFHKTYLNYFAAYMAQQISFAELYSELVELGCSQRFAWNVTLKNKRGLKDTSQPGGFSKNHIYFEGLVKIWKWLMADNDPKLLYAGRIALEEVDKLQTVELSDQVVYPTFFSNIELYKQKIVKLGNINLLGELGEKG